MNFLATWLTGYFNPGRAFERVADKPVTWGLSGVLVCWTGRALLLVLPLYLMGYPLLTDPWIPIPAQHYYLAEVFFFPVLGILQWLSGGLVMYLLLRLVNGIRVFRPILNYIGLSALIIFPVGVVMDWIIIAAGGWSLPVLAITHSLLAAYGVFLGTIALIRIFKLRLWLALLLNFAVLPVDILWGAVFSR
jgi:hypothetical protein